MILATFYALQRVRLLVLSIGRLNLAELLWSTAVSQVNSSGAGLNDGNVF